MSGADSETGKLLHKIYDNTIIPEVDANPTTSIEIINKAIKENKPDIIVGSSLGGFYTLLCDSSDIPILVINPSIKPQDTLKKCIGKELEYFCNRKDGKKTYTLTKDVYDSISKYDAIDKAKEKKDVLWSVCSTKDDILGTTHIDILERINTDHIFKTDEIGHRLDKKFINGYLKEIIDNIIEENSYEKGLWKIS